VIALQYKPEQEESKNSSAGASEHDVLFACTTCGTEIMIEHGKKTVVCAECGQQFEKHCSRESAEARLATQPSTKPKGIIELDKNLFILSYYFVPTKRFEVKDLTELLDTEVIRMIQGGLDDRFEQPSAIFVKSDKNGKVLRIVPSNPFKWYNRFCIEIWNHGGKEKCLETAINEVRKIFAEKSPKSRYTNSECWLGLTGFFVPLVLFNKTLAILNIGQVRLTGEEAERDLKNRIEENVKELSIPAQDLLKLAFDENIVRAMSPEEARHFLGECNEAGIEILRLAEKTYITERKLREQQFIDELTSLFDIVYDYESLNATCEKITKRIVDFLGMKYGVLLTNDSSQPSHLKVFGSGKGIQGTDSDNISFLLSTEDHKILDRRKPFFCDERNRLSICAKVCQAFMAEKGSLSCLLPCMLGHKKMAVFCLFGESGAALEDSEDRFSVLDIAFLERLLHELEIQLGKNLAILDLEQSLRDREEYLAHTSHILKSQMHRLLGKTEFLKRKCMDAPEKKEVVAISEEIDEEVRRMNHRTDTLLHFVSGGKEGQKYPHRFDKKSSLYQLLKDVKSQFSYAVQARGIIIDIITAGQLPDTYFDRPSMEIAIANIIDNAVKYSHYNCSINILMSHDWTNQLTHIEISDFGIGIPEDELEKIFMPFFRGKWQDPRRFIHGTGISLAVAKDIISAHGGRIWCQSVSGKGAGTTDDSSWGFKVTFFIEIPDEPKEPK